MALVKCKECGSQVSTSAKACPNCGAKPPKQTSLITWAVLILILFVVFSSMCSDKTSAPSQMSAAEIQAETERKAAADQEAREFAWIEKGKAAAQAKLKDPASAQFKDVYFYHAKGGVPVACGQVNSKNSFGGYGGYQYFVSAGSPELTFLQEQVKDFEEVFNKFCTGERKAN